MARRASPSSHRLASVALAILITTTLAGCLDTDPGTQTDTTPAHPETHPLFERYDGLANAPEIRFETDLGTIRLILYTQLMPTTTAHMARLTESGFYGDTLIHRVVDDFVIQGGDPSDTGQFGSGTTIPHETHPDLMYVGGAMGMARDLDPDSGDSQWFITERPAPHLHDPQGTTGDVFGSYALFGQVIEGMDVVRDIASQPVVPGADRPITDIYLQRATLLPPPTDIDVLHYPPRLDGPYTVGNIQVEISRPVETFADHAFPITVTLEPTDDMDAASPPNTVRLEHRPADEDPNDPIIYTYELAPVADDPWVFQGEATIPETGEWVQFVYVQGTTTPPLHFQVVPLDPTMRLFLPQNRATDAAASTNT